jgi:hypothetical protein
MLQKEVHSTITWLIFILLLLQFIWSLILIGVNKSRSDKYNKKNNITQGHKGIYSMHIMVNSLIAFTLGIALIYYFKSVNYDASFDTYGDIIPLILAILCEFIYLVANSAYEKDNDLPNIFMLLPILLFLGFGSYYVFNKL